MLLFHSIKGGAKGDVLVQTSLVPMSSTSLVLMVTGLESSIPVLLFIQGVWFAPTLYTVMISVTSYILDNLCALGEFSIPVLMVKTGWLFTQTLLSVEGAITKASLCQIPIIRLLN